MEQEKLNVAIVLFDGVELLDFAGPGEVFERAADGEAFNVFTVTSTLEPILSQGFVKILPEYSVENSPKPDILVIPGGVRYATLEDKKLLDWAKTVTQSAKINMSVCTGSFIFAKLGMLDGKQATTHYASIEKLKDYAPKAEILSNIRYVDEGHMITTAGVSAGIDASLYVVSKILGEQTAKDVAHYMEYFWDPENVTNPLSKLP